MTYQIGTIPGDGIGREVIPEAIRVMNALEIPFEVVPFDLGGERYLRDGHVLDGNDLEAFRRLDAIFLGAVGTPEVPPGVIERGLLLEMRFQLDQYINQRPFRSAPNRHNEGVDFIVIRENTEGSYAGEGGSLRSGTPHEIATQGSVNTRMGVERCIRYAFELAMQRRKHLTLVHKTNVLTFAGGLWQRTFDEVGASFPEVDTAYQHVDAATIYLVSDPARYDVIVTDNLFGDILTDLAGAISGGIGRAASANLNPDRVAPSMFEPVHGSAPDIAGKGLADPRAAILSAAMMLEFLGEPEAAQRIRTAIDATTLVDGGTIAIATAVVEQLNSN